MRLRWVITQHKITADEVREYAQTKHVAMSEAKHTLLQRSQPKLQYLGDDMRWYDVPTEVVEF